MKLIAKLTVIVKPLGAIGPFGTRTVRAGEEFECDDEIGKRYVESGVAVEKPKPVRRPAAKTATTEEPGE